MTGARGFSNSIRPPTSGGAGILPWVVGAGALGGFTYLNWKMSEMKTHQAQYMMQGETFMSPITQQRLGQTFGFFTYGLLTTGATCYALRNSLAWAAVPWWAFMIGGIGLLVGTHMTPYEGALPLKLAFYTGFAGCMGLQILPLVQMSSMAMIADAALATGLSMGALSYIAYKAPSEQFLNWGGPLSLACGGMMAVSMLSIFNPASKALFNIWLYGGLGLTGMLTLFKTQAILHNAKTHQSYDPLGNAVGIYLDAINFFIRFLMIMQNSKKK
jgi:FtsH-binding integral membrane protein